MPRSDWTWQGSIPNSKRSANHRVVDEGAHPGVGLQRRCHLAPPHIDLPRSRRAQLAGKLPPGKRRPVTQRTPTGCCVAERAHADTPALSFSRRARSTVSKCSK